MTRKKAWMIAAGVTVTVVLLVLAAGASFGQFGLGPSGGSRAQASGSGQQAERRELDADDSVERESGEDDEGKDDDEEGYDDHDDGDRHEDDEDEHEEEDD